MEMGEKLKPRYDLGSPAPYDEACKDGLTFWVFGQIITVADWGDWIDSWSV